MHRNKKAHLISRVMRVGLSTRQECPFVLQWGAAQTDEKATSDSPIRGVGVRLTVASHRVYSYRARFPWIKAATLSAFCSIAV